MRTLLIAAVIGGLVSIVVGYFVYAAPGNAVEFDYWVGRPFRFAVWAWASAGACVGIGLVTLFRRP